MRSRRADKAERAAKARLRAKRRVKRYVQQAAHARERLARERLIDIVLQGAVQALLDIPGARPLARKAAQEAIQALRES